VPVHPSGCAMWDQSMRVDAACPHSTEPPIRDVVLRRTQSPSRARMARISCGTTDVRVAVLAGVRGLVALR
jgi:hypothetical protein